MRATARRVMDRWGNRRRDCTVIAERHVQAMQIFGESNKPPCCPPERVYERVMRRWLLHHRGTGMMVVKEKELGLLFEAHLACWESPKGEEEDLRSLIRGSDQGT